MNKQTIAEAYALERVMDFMTEGSFTYLAEQDPSFDHFLGSMYRSLDTRAAELRRLATA